MLFRVLVYIIIVATLGEIKDFCVILTKHLKFHYTSIKTLNFVTKYLFYFFFVYDFVFKIKVHNFLTNTLNTNYVCFIPYFLLKLK